MITIGSMEENFSLTQEILEMNGWECRNGVCVLRSNPRLGWYVGDHRMIVGYYTFPIKIDKVGELFQLMQLCGLKEQIDTFKLHKELKMTKKELLESEAFKNAPDDATIMIDDLFKYRAIRVVYDETSNQLLVL